LASYTAVLDCKIGQEASIAIIGAGPTGLGAANRLRELGYRNFAVFEKEAYPGGLAASFVDRENFVWDIGGHVHFSHYEYFDHLMNDLLPAEWLSHNRESWIWTHEEFVPYPFQNNIHRLPDVVMRECLGGLIRASRTASVPRPANYEEWILQSLGEGIAHHFMLPYCFKVWAYEARDLAYGWVGERVALVDLERVVFNILDRRDDIGWGPNATFRFPRNGGTGEIWRRLASRLLPGTIRFNKSVERIDTSQKVIRFEDGSTTAYDLLISTMPIDLLVRKAGLKALTPMVDGLLYSSTHVIGIGLAGAPPMAVGKKLWMYFPEKTTPFYRATVFSNFSPNNVPEIGRYWSLIVEVSESPRKRVDAACVVDSVIDGLLAARLIQERADVSDVWHFRTEYGYPTPSLTRDRLLAAVQPRLEELSIFSRGRFGAWKYEVSNQDHSLMQGVELIDRLLLGTEELTVNHPNIVNANKVHSAIGRAVTACADAATSTGEFTVGRAWESK